MQKTKVFHRCGCRISSSAEVNPRRWANSSGRQRLTATGSGAGAAIAPAARAGGQVPCDAFLQDGGRPPMSALTVGAGQDLEHQETTLGRGGCSPSAPLIKGRRATPLEHLPSSIVQEGSWSKDKMA